MTLALYDPLRPVLTHVLVDRSTEADDGIGTRVTYIDAHKHSHRIDLLRELQVVQVSSKFAVHLPQDVASNRELHTSSEVVILDTLGDKLIGIANCLDSFVVLLI